jgi:hypothetical protein
VKALPCNGHIYLLIKNLFPSSGHCSAVSRPLPSGGSIRYCSVCVRLITTGKIERQGNGKIQALDTEGPKADLKSEENK